MTNLHVSKHPLVACRVTELRDKDTPPARFRELVADLAVMLMYEAMLELETEPVTVQTPLASANGSRLKARIGLMPIMRAGNQMGESLLKLIGNARLQHIGLYRDEETLKPVLYYDKLRDASNVVDIWYILDPMLATGGSAVLTANYLKEHGATRIVFLGLIAAPEGVKHLTECHPDVRIYAAALDEKLNEHGYILPGLGDAGDRINGTL